MNNGILAGMLRDLRVTFARNRDMLDSYREFAKAALECRDPKMVARAEALLESHKRLDAINDAAHDVAQAQARAAIAYRAPRRAKPRKKRDWFDKMTDWLC